MKSLILASVLVFGLGTAAYAADAVVDEVVVVDNAYNWSGVYVGAQVGYGWGNNDYHYYDESVGFDSDGFAGGLTVGVNWQNGDFVYGLEADVSFSGIDGTALSDGVAPCYIEGCSADIDWFGTGRARLGYAVDNFLPYVTGGVAFGGLEGTADLGACDFSVCTYDDTRFGWTAGVGIEWGLTQQISLKAEYLHVDLGSVDFDTDEDVSADVTLDTVRFGVNYRF